MWCGVWCGVCGAVVCAVVCGAMCAVVFAVVCGAMCAVVCGVELIPIVVLHTSCVNTYEGCLERPAVLKEEDIPITN